MTKEDIKKKDIVYHARTIPQTGIYEVRELIVRTIADTYFVGTDKKDKHAFLLPYSSLNKTIFLNRKDALRVVNKSEKNKMCLETFYEEY